jgi:hypothetical protein
VDGSLFSVQRSNEGVAVRHVGRLRNHFVVGLVVLALLPVAFDGGGVGAADDGGGEAPPELGLPSEGVLDQVRNGEDAIEELEAGGHLEAVAESVDWSPDELRATLASDDSLYVKPDGQLWYQEFASGAQAAPESLAEAAGMAGSLAGYSDAETFQLHSLPESTKTVYLDFVGMASNWEGKTLYGFDLDGSLPCPPGTVDPACFSSAELAMIREIWMRVSEYYAAFDVDVTTEYPGLDAMKNLSCRISSGFTFCPDGVTPESPDQEYGARVSFVSDTTYSLGTPCLSPGVIGCAKTGQFNANWFMAAIDYVDPAAYVLGVPNQWAPTKQASPLSARALAEVAAHEIGHVMSLKHEANLLGTYAYMPDIEGSVWRALMNRFTAGDGAPRSHFTPQICSSFEESTDRVDACELDLKWEFFRNDSYARMARSGVVARADEPSPVVAAGPSFVASGVISPPLLTKRTIVSPGGFPYTTFYSPSPAPQDFSYTKGPTTGPGKLEYGGGLNLTQVDGSGTDIGSILDTADDAYPLRTFITLFDSNSQWEDWAVLAVTSSPGVKNLSAQRVGASSGVQSNGFPDGTPLTVRYHGTGASGPMDTDSYEFTVPPGAGPTSISVTPAPTSNLDVKATLYDATMTEVAVSDPRATRIDVNTVTGLDASIEATLAPGAYTLVVDGVGVPGSYTNYGSIGSYTVAVHTSFDKGVSVGSASVAEGDTGKPRVITFPVVLPAPATSTVTVDYAIEPDGSANGATLCVSTTTCQPAGDGDVRSRTGTVTFRPSAKTGLTPTVKYVNALVYPDTLTEGDETFWVVLSNPVGVELGRAIGVGTILDDDPTGGVPQVAIGDASMLEGDAGVKATKANKAKLWVTLSEPATAPVTVTVTVSPGTATPATDFSFGSIRSVFPVTKTITFAAGQWKKPVTIGVFPDTVVEADETVTVTLSDPTGGPTIGRGIASLRILDDD